MKRLFCLLAVFLMSISVPTLGLGGETGAKQQMIRAKISKVDCDKGTITVSGVKDVRSSKKELPDVTLKLTDATKLTGAKACKEIQEGTDILAAYVESDQGNVATEVILPRRKDLADRIRDQRNKNVTVTKEELEKSLQQRGAREGAVGKNEANEGQQIEKEPGGNDK